MGTVLVLMILLINFDDSTFQSAHMCLSEYQEPQRKDFNTSQLHICMPYTIYFNQNKMYFIMNSIIGHMPT